MRKMVLLCAAVCVLLAACGMPMFQNIVMYPQPPDGLYDKMILTLQELGYTIKNTDKGSYTILAEKLTTGEAFNAALGGQGMPFQASINFSPDNGGSKFSITITQPGKIVKSGFPKKLSSEIQRKFEEKIKSF